MRKGNGFLIGHDMVLAFSVLLIIIIYTDTSFVNFV